MSVLPKDGFLSTILDEWSAETKKSAQKWFSLINELNIAAVAVLPSLELQRSAQKEIVAAALYARALQTFEASVLLTGRGMLADSETLARSVAETAFFLGGLAVINNFLVRMAGANNSHFFKLGYASVELLKRENKSLNPDAAELKQFLDEAKLQGYRENNINLNQLAKEVGMEALYDTVYRQLSGNAAHPSVASSERHIMRGIGGNVENLIFKPQRNGVEKALSVALFAFLSALEAIGVIFKRADIQTTVELYNIRHQALSNELSSRAGQ
ncbi:DUF5677 domain-containing protein [Janthinobacterium sp. SUN176]|uniref:DUF5677 domain-containing protein n=1 Tax=Janthinobacterium sp. SUN176 TaxID=3014788 RepID=UPI00271319CE|nr:DUF5677 domain-containing protein [Janthinobacterium sp. SUN176]MDO8070007.1 DUF5677 domain-containing protein [Janthinobacterium sp. SUN176]